MKSIAYFVVGLLLLSGFAAISIGEEASEKQTTINTNFLEPRVVVKETFVELEVDGTNSYICNPGEPKLPIHTEVLTLPFGTTITNIECEAQEIETMVLSKKIKPFPQPYIKSNLEILNEPVMNEEIYDSEDFFPDNWFSYHVGVGLDKNMDHKTFLKIDKNPVRYSPTTDTIIYAKKIDLTVKYNEPTTNPFPGLQDDYDLVIIAPAGFSNDLQKLIDHKNGLDPPVNTTLKTIQDIYSEYIGYDKPEEIKLFIQDAIENWGVRHVLLVGGLDSLIWAQGKDKNNMNAGTKDWYIPVRYSNLRYGEPGFISDLYYADIYREGGVFDNWDKNGNEVFGQRNDQLDLYPDVNVGRLACRNKWEVRSMVDKIIRYENGPCDPSWFEDMLVISGDGFMDQPKLNIQWDTLDLPDGEYTIYAHSTNPDMDSGPVEEIHVTLDKTQETKLTFNHDDHTRVSTYPAKPIAEIVSVTDGDILGNTDFYYNPTEQEAYGNRHNGWGRVEYKNEVLYIRGKTYDPRPYGVNSTIHVEIKNSGDITVFTAEKTTPMYFEGEWATGEKLLLGRAGGAYYMPAKFNTEFLWTSNGKWTGQNNVINAFSKGTGFTFFSGHANPWAWSNHMPGIPGNRGNAHVDGLKVIDLIGGPPFFPMERLSNRYENPVVVVGGCHNSMFNVSFISTFLDPTNAKNTHCYGVPTAECWSWWLTRLSKRGAIACIGNTGYGLGTSGDKCTTGGLDNWITTEMFVQYGAEGHEILGEAYSRAVASYLDTFGRSQSWHLKTIEQIPLLGDPSLKIGGYENSGPDVEIIVDSNGFYVDGTPGKSLGFEADPNGGGTPTSYQWSFDKDGDYDNGEYDTFSTGEEVTETWDKPGIYWVLLEATYGNGHTETIHTIVDIENDEFPDAPTKPTGETSVRLGLPYIYTTKATDPYDIDLYYLFDWGDGTYSVKGPKESGTTVSATHIWSEKGDYEVKIMAINAMGLWSDWSEPLDIIVEKARTRDVLNEPLLQLLQKFLENYPNAFPILRYLLGL